jgi:hypothetical protein
MRSLFVRVSVCVCAAWLLIGVAANPDVTIRSQDGTVGVDFVGASSYATPRGACSQRCRALVSRAAHPARASLLCCSAVTSGGQIKLFPSTDSNKFIKIKARRHAG